jgi:hypothetical protein
MLGMHDINYVFSVHVFSVHVHAFDKRHNWREIASADTAKATSIIFVKDALPGLLKLRNANADSVVHVVSAGSRSLKGSSCC